MNLCRSLGTSPLYLWILQPPRPGTNEGTGCCSNTNITLHVCGFLMIVLDSPNFFLVLLVTLPLWTPSNVALGAVGFHEKPSGKFVTLFNSFKPSETSRSKAEGIPSLYGYGRVNQGSQRLDKRNVAQKGMDIIHSWITARSKGDGQFA